MATGKQRKARESPERQLADAQAKLHSLQEKRKRVVAEAELSVERARKRAAKRVDAITKEVERRAGKVARAQAKLAAGSTRGRPPEKARTVETHSAPATTATAAADRPTDMHQQTRAAHEPAAVVMPAAQAASVSTARVAPSLDRHQQQALAALRDRFSVNGATFTEWLATAGLSKRPFLAARRSLVDAGLVAHAGEGQGARYVVTEAGVLALS